MASYRLTRRADKDLIDIYLHTLRAFGLAQAERYVDDMRSCLDLLASNPRLGRRADMIRPGTRRHEHGQHVIFYREDPEHGGLLIQAVIHRKRRPQLDPKEPT